MSRAPGGIVRRVRHERDSGISLVELIVAMVLLGIASTIVIGLFLSTTKTIAMANSIHNDTGTAANIMNELSQVIRSGTTNPVSGGASEPAVITATPKKLVLYTYADSDAALPRPVKVEFVRSDSSGQLVERRWAPSAAANGFWDFKSPTLISTRTFPGVLDNTAVFTYNTTTGASYSTPTSAQIATVSSISVTVIVHADAKASDSAVTLRNTVGMPNLGLSQTGTP